MKYSSDRIRQDLKALGVSGWAWPGNGPARKVPGARTVLDEIAAYCWVAYEKSYSDPGDLVIGREKDLNAAGLYDKVAEIARGQTLFDRGTRGNLLKMDRWAPVMNDAWILGGVHRRARFRLASPRIMDNLWNETTSYFVVTAREVRGLRHFGYEFEQIGPWQFLLSQNAVRAAAADLLQYDEMIRKRETIQEARQLADDEGGSAKRAAAQIGAARQRR